MNGHSPQSNNRHYRHFRNSPSCFDSQCDCYPNKFTVTTADQYHPYDDINNEIVDDTIKKRDSTVKHHHPQRFHQYPPNPKPNTVSFRSYHTSRSICNRNSSTENSDYHIKRTGMKNEIDKLPETMAYHSLIEFLQSKSNSNVIANGMILPPIPPMNGYKYEMSKEQMMITLDSILMTFLLHIESRIGSLIGKSYYTIGPCGEETLAPTAFSISPYDSVALHYRHVSMNITKQLWHRVLHNNDNKDNNNTNNDINTANHNILNNESYLASLNDIILDRVRGYTVSALDPVTGGVHCSIGSKSSALDQYYGAGDFIVTSTLSSQCPSAVGRALGYALRNYLFQSKTDWIDCPEKKQISMVTLGDGSIHNHHFWSSYHLARHAKHQNIKCPVVFGISDNGLSISYKTKGYVDTIFNGTDPLIPTYIVNGNDIMDVYSQTKESIQYTRHKSSPSVIVYKNLMRRFGHAATDRQNAYMTLNEIQSRWNSTVLQSMMIQLVEVYNVTSYSDILHRLWEIQSMILEAFCIASNEPKVTRYDMIHRVEPPLVPSGTKTNDHDNVNFVETIQFSNGELVHKTPTYQNDDSNSNKKDVMRKHMTRVIRELMINDPSIVYIGEDVQHGGYYVVTENLHNEFPHRIIDFPPDETSLLGVGLGYSQIGLLPIIEIPYSKYLDCGVDMFNEIAIQYWLSNGQRKNGMIIRLQGFDKGLFGGNFHTSNTLSHISPGMDYICYSNGYDYVRGLRYAVHQAKHTGRIIVLVDCTYLLNVRHIHNKDRNWERIYPHYTNDDGNDMMPFDVVCRYTGHSTKEFDAMVTTAVKQTEIAPSCIVTYGNGVLTSLQARTQLLQNGIITSECDIDIIDCPYLSTIPRGLIQLLGRENAPSNHVTKTQFNDASSKENAPSNNATKTQFNDASSKVRYEYVLLADICKSGPGTGNVMTNMACQLHDLHLLPKDWSIVSAPRTYNPLGNMVTFLSVDDIVTAWTELIS